MKFASLFLISYVLFLSVQPCEDVLAQFDGQGHRISSTPHIETPSDTESSDNCSPFCICSCCSMPVASRHSAISVPQIENSIQNREIAADYRSPYQSKSLAEIWQPPKA